MPITYKANIRSYLGVPILYKNGEMFGTLCAIDSKPTNFTNWDIKTFERLSRLFSHFLELDKKAKYDTLTGLYNRYFLYSSFDHVSKDKGSIMLLDLDGFKQVNDKYGHDVGDNVLKEVGYRIKQCLDTKEIGVRLGGDEFIILYPYLVDTKLVEEKAKLILKALSSWDEFEYKVNLSVSIGIACYPDNAIDLKSLLKFADIAMYHAKEAGKNNHKFFSTDWAVY